jgi:hypothetical protein
MDDWNVQLGVILRILHNIRHSEIELGEGVMISCGG